MENIQQRSGDDCSVCTIAMITGESWETVHEAAKLCGYVFGSGKGVSLGHVIFKLGYDVNWLEGFHNKPNSIISVDSLYRENGKHAVVHCDGVILDPSSGDRHVTLCHAMKTASYTYFNIKKCSDD